MLKRFLLVLTVACLFCAVGSVAIAQDSGASNQQSAPAEGGRGRGQFDPAKRAEMLGKQLNLSSDQQSKVGDILKSQQSQMQNLRSDTSASQEDRRSKMMEIRKSSNDQIRALLNEDQQKKWDEMQSRQQERMQHRGAPGGSTNNPPQQQ